MPAVFDNELRNAFSDSLDLLQRGASIEDCLRRYPRYAPALRSLLETGRLIERAQVSRIEATQAQQSVRWRIEAALDAPIPRRRTYPLRQFATLAAAIAIIVVIGGAIRISRDSIPGDLLYGLKRLSENAELSLSPGIAMEAELSGRRIDEIRQVLVLRRVVEVEFRGTVELQLGTDWIIAGLPISVPVDVASPARITVGSTVTVHGYTRPDGSLVASDIQMAQLDDMASPVLTETQTPTPTGTPTSTPTATPTPMMTDTATLTVTVVPSPGVAPTLTGTLRSTLAVSPTPQPVSVTLTSVLSPSATTCSPHVPAGWVTYRVQVGDTLSHLAAATGVSLARLMDVNCLTDARFIVVGQSLALPFRPARPTSPINAITPSGSAAATEIPLLPGSNPPLQTGSPANDNDNDDHGGGNNNSNDNSNDNRT